MNKKNTFGTLLALVALLVQAFLVPQPAAAAPCDAARFIADITYPDGALVNPGASFTKTWRVQNVGTCTWTTGYSLIYLSGTQMSQVTAQNFQNNVAPGGTIDLSILMTAPTASGTYRTDWLLKNVNTSTFGIGYNASLPFWVQIRVNAGSGTSTSYNFAEHVGDATWTNGPGSRIDNPRLENGTTYNGAGLEMILPNSPDSLMWAIYPALHVQSGDHFQSIINCEYQATSCFVGFRLDYQIDGGAVHTLKSFRERYDSLFYNLDVDLSGLAGQDVKFILRVDALGSAAGDRVIWAGPRITNANSGPTPTITPTVTGTPPTPTKTPVPNSGCDRATFIADFNVPDGTVFGPNAPFTKTWSIKNTGTCIWTTAYKLVFFDGSQIGGPQEQNLTSTIGPNTTVKISVGLTSPGTNGHYIGYWMLKNANGAMFGIGPGANKPFWVDIYVRGGNNYTPTPTTTGTPPTPTATGSAPSSTPTPNLGPDRVRFISDVTIQDGSVFGPNHGFTKTWRLQNVGSRTWTTAYKLVYVSGPQMSGPSEQNLTSSVAPGQIADISVNLTSPSTNGTYRGYWMLKNAAGQLFGIGNGYFNRPFWVDIKVSGAASLPDLTVISVLSDGNQTCFSSSFKNGVRVVIKNEGSANVTNSFVVDVNNVQQTFAAGLAAGQSASLWFDVTGTTATAFVDATSQIAEISENNNKQTQQLVQLTAPPPCTTGTPTGTPTVTATPGTRTTTPTPTTTPTAVASNCDRAAMVRDVTVPDGTVFGPNVAFTKTWELRNVGTCTWSTSYQLVFASGDMMGGPTSVNLPNSVAPNGFVDVSVTLTSPAANGSYKGFWQLKNASGAPFGIGANANTAFWVEIVVQGGSTGPTATVTRTLAPGTATVTPTVTPTATATTFGSFALFGMSDGLSLLSTPASGTTLASIAHNVTNLSRTGASSTVSSSEWWQVSVPAGPIGWVKSENLTEYVPPLTFCADGRVATLLANLANALKTSNGAGLAALVSPKHGLRVYLASSNPPVTYTQATAAAVFTSTSSQNWGPAPASGDAVSGTFKDIMLPKFSEIYNSNFEVGCNDTSKLASVSQPWPADLSAINFYSVYKPATGTNLDWRDLLAGIEYVNGQPFLVALINFEWAP